MTFFILFFQEDELRKSEVEADKDKMMREYRAQLDAERASKLAHGRNYSSSKSNHKKGRLRNTEISYILFFFLISKAHFLTMRLLNAEKRDRALKKRSSKKRKVCSIVESQLSLPLSP